jgi:hypothetical protein
MYEKYLTQMNRNQEGIEKKIFHIIAEKWRESVEVKPDTSLDCHRNRKSIYMVAKNQA